MSGVNLAACIEDHPADAPALISRGRVTTYGELRRQAAQLRGGLGRLGVEPGDRVAIVAANNWFFVVSYLALTGAGAIAVPLNPSSPPVELGHQLEATAARVAIVGPSGRAAVEALDRSRLPVEHLVAPERIGLTGAESLDALIPGEEAPIVERDPSDVAVLMFTAGTAGAPKPAMLTHGNLLANIEQMQARPGTRVEATDRGLGVLPLFHIFGLNVVLGVTLAAGAAVVLVERFDPVAALETIANHEVSVVCGAPPMYTSWLGLPASSDADTAAALRSVRLAVSGAAALGAEVLDAFRRRFGVEIHEGYGLTEASPTVTSSRGAGPVKAGSIGLPLPGIEVRLVDEDGEDALVGDPGELWVRGPNVFAGYWNEPEATERALAPGGWLRTGDIAVADADGALYLVDRAKDLVNVSGFSVYPAEVEEVLAEHPGVASVAVVGEQHPHTGETVRAFVVAVPGYAVEEDELIEWCGRSLARYKCPTKITFVEELPQNAAGKLLRHRLR